MDDCIENFDLDQAICDGDGIAVFNVLDKLTSEELAIIRNKYKSTIKKALNDKSMSTEEINKTSIIQNKLSYLIKAMINSRFSDNGISTTRISSSIVEAINNI